MQQTGDANKNETMFGCEPEPTAVFYLAVVAAVIAPFMNLVGGGEVSGYYASLFGAGFILIVWIAVRIIWAIMSIFIGKEFKEIEE